jgi:hypothetical protein
MIYLVSLENHNPYGENVLHSFATTLVRSDEFMPNRTLETLTETYIDFLESILARF